MKPLTITALVILAVGVYIEYQKDSSFASVDAGSLIAGGALGLLVGGMI
jgi:lipoprotein signal peptidase